MQREVGDGLANHRDGVLQQVFFGAGDAHHVALDAALDLHLAVLDLLDDFFRQFLLDAFTHCYRLLHLVAADGFAIADFQAAGVDAALRQLCSEYVADLTQFEVIVGEYGDGLFLLVHFNAGIGALEIETGGHFLVGLVDGVMHFHLIDFGNDVE